jgi:hypothetical protein
MGCIVQKDSMIIQRTKLIEIFTEEQVGGVIGNVSELRFKYNGKKLKIYYKEIY